MVGERELLAHHKRNARFQAGALVTLIPLVSACLGAFQLYRDDEKREFDAITFYLQNQRLFDPCQDPALTNLNLRMINDRYPRVYTRIVEHVEDRSAQCDAVPPSLADPSPVVTGPSTAPRNIAKNAEPPGDGMGGALTTESTEPLAAPPASTPPPVDASTFFRNRYDRLTALPAPRNRKVTEGRYRILVEIADEQDRVLAGTLAGALRGLGHATPTIERAPIRLETSQLRYYHESQRGDAERLAAELERLAGQSGSAIRIVPTYIGREYPGLPPGVMELWLE